MQYSSRVGSIGMFSAILLSLISPAAMRAQSWMPDSSSTTLDVWSDSTTVYSYAFTFGSMSVHTYAVDVSIQSSSGRYISFPGYLNPGTVSTYGTMSWDFFDDGEYTVTSVHRGYCLAAQLEFSLAWSQFKKRPGNKPPCAGGVSAASCNDGNTLAPIGRRVRQSCKQESECCKSGGAVAPGWCRKEQCLKTSDQSTDPQPAGCIAEQACNDFTITAFCLGLN